MSSNDDHLIFLQVTCMPQTSVFETCLKQPLHFPMVLAFTGFSVVQKYFMSCALADTST